MSLFAPCLSFLAIKPKVWCEDDKLYARASLALRIASLGSYDRCVIADKQDQTISIYAKNWWQWQPEEKIPFNRVDEIDRSFHRWTTKWANYDGGYYRRWRNDQLEFLKVSLFLRDPQENLDLFWFWGEGAVKSGATGVLLGNDDVVDFSGDQRATSERYAKLLSAFINTRVHDFPAQGLMETIDQYRP